MRTVAVTGAGGLVGTALVAALRGAGLAARRLTRSPAEADDRRFVLGERVEPAALAGCDALIHAAHDFTVDAAGQERVNLAGSLALLEAARAARVERLIFVSSISAFPGCASAYGRTKLALEEAFARAGGIVVRPGLVYGGAGGMYAALTRLCRLPILPVFDGGRQPLWLVGVDETARDLVHALSWDPKIVAAPVTLAHREPVAFADLLRAIARREGRAVRLVSLPSVLALAPLRALEAAGLPLRFRSDSLMSLLRPNPAPDWSWQDRLSLAYRKW